MYVGSPPPKVNPGELGDQSGRQKEAVKALEQLLLEWPAKTQTVDAESARERAVEILNQMAECRKLGVQSVSELMSSDQAKEAWYALCDVQPPIHDKPFEAERVVATLQSHFLESNDGSRTQEKFISPSQIDDVDPSTSAQVKVYSTMPSAGEFSKKEEERTQAPPMGALFQITRLHDEP